MAAEGRGEHWVIGRMGEPAHPGDNPDDEGTNHVQRIVTARQLLAGVQGQL